jgi:hypothetical protein
MWGVSVLSLNQFLGQRHWGRTTRAIRALPHPWECVKLIHAQCSDGLTPRRPATIQIALKPSGSCTPAGKEARVRLVVRHSPFAGKCRKCLGVPPGDRGSKPAFAGGQYREGFLRSQVGPVQCNLTLAAFLVEKTDSVFAAVFFAGEGFKLAARERMKGMCYPKLLGFCPTNTCSAMPFPTTCGTRVSWAFEGIRTPRI